MTEEIPIILNKFPKSKQWGRDFIEQWDDIAIATIMTWMDFFHYEDNKSIQAIKSNILLWLMLILFENAYK